MKRIITTLLAFVMIVTCFTVAPMSAFARNKNTLATATPLALNQKAAVTFTTDYNNDLDDTDYYFSFVAPTTDYYQFDVDNFYQEPTKDYGQTSIDIYDSYEQCVEYGKYYQALNRCFVAAKLTQGMKYYINLECYSYDNNSDYDEAVSHTFYVTPSIHTHEYKVTDYSTMTEYDCVFCDYEYSVNKYNNSVYVYDGGTVITNTPTCTHGTTHIDGYYAPTYFTTGYTGNVVCSTCGVSISTGVVTAKKKVSVSSVKGAKKKFTAKWKKASGANGYQVKYSLKKNMKSSKTVTVKKGSTTSKSISKLKAKKKYYVQVRAYKTVKGKKVYSSWSSVKSVKTK